MKEAKSAGRFLALASSLLLCALLTPAQAAEIPFVSRNALEKPLTQIVADAATDSTLTLHQTADGSIRARQYVSQTDAQGNTNWVWENVSLSPPTGSGDALYTQTSVSSVSQGRDIELTAVPAAGKRFYGWLDANKHFLHSDPTYTYRADQPLELYALFADENSYAFRKNDTFYAAGSTTLPTLVGEAARGDILEVMQNVTLEQDLTIPGGVTVYLSYGVYNSKGHTNGTGTSLDGAKPSITFTVANGRTLTVNGTLISSAVMSTTSHEYQGHTSGAYAEIQNNGTITVNGVLDMWGYLKGAGSVQVNNGGRVYEPFIVADYSGGTNTTSMYLAGHCPFKRYAFINIQCPLQINSGGSLYGHCNLYAGGGYNETDAPVVASNGLYKPSANTTILRTYDPSKALKNGPSGTAGIGRTNWEVTGGLTFQYLEMYLFGVNVSIKDLDFPVPYNFSFHLKDGDYYVPARLKLMPGAEMDVQKDATLHVSGWLYVLDGLKQGMRSSKAYPSTEQLQANSYSASAVLNVDGKLVVEGSTVQIDGVNQPARLAGIVQTSGSTGQIVLGSDANVEDIRIQDGCEAGMSDDRAILTLSARVCVDGTIKPLTPGSTYYAQGDTSFVLPEYTVEYCVDGVNGGLNRPDGKPVPGHMETVTVAIKQNMTGAWGTTFKGFDIRHCTYYDETDNSCTRSMMVVGQSSTFQVECQKPDYRFIAEGIAAGKRRTISGTVDADGIYTYTVPADVSEVIILSALIGDVDLNGSVEQADVLLLGQAEAARKTLNDLQTCLADYDQDGLLTALDLFQIKQLAGKGA